MLLVELGADIGHTHPKAISSNMLITLVCIRFNGMPSASLIASIGCHHCIKLTLLKLRLIAPP